MQGFKSVVPRDRLSGLILRALEEAPIAALLGARQVGKTTLPRSAVRRPPRPGELADARTRRGGRPGGDPPTGGEDGRVRFE